MAGISGHGIERTWDLEMGTARMDERRSGVVSNAEAPCCTFDSKIKGKNHIFSSFIYVRMEYDFVIYNS